MQKDGGGGDLSATMISVAAPVCLSTLTVVIVLASSRGRPPFRVE